MRITYENQHTGLRTFELSPIESQAVDTFLGGKLAETARGYRINKRGLVTFKGGLGYNVIDTDLLGGDGTGRTHTAFNDIYPNITL